MNLTAAAIRLSAVPFPARLNEAAAVIAGLEGRRFDLAGAAALFDALTAGPSVHAAATTEWLDRFPDSPTAMYLRARSYSAKKSARAAGCWREFLSLTACRDPLTLLQAARAFAADGQWVSAASSLRDALAGRPEYTFYARAQRFVREVAEHAPADLRQVRIAVLGSATTSLIIPVIDALCFRDRIHCVCYEGLFGAYRQEILDPDSGLYRFAPDIVFIIPTSHDLDLPSLAERDEGSDGLVAEHVGLWNALSSRSHCHIVQHAFDYPETESAGSLAGRRRGGRRRVLRHLNLRLAEAAPSFVSILDTERLIAEVGVHAWHDSALWYHARQFPSPRAIPALAEEQLAYVRAAAGLMRKVVICDLDNTLWGGVVGEDGVTGIRVGGPSPEGEAYAELQRYLKELRARGILLAVASKNNPDDARQPFREVDGMVLRLEDFAAFEACWDDKVTSIRRISATLSLGLDTFVVLDDNPLERAWIRSQLPEVAVVELGESAATFVRELDAGKYFEALDVSEEDTRRADMYRRGAAQQELRGQAASLEEFLAALHMRAGVHPVSEGTVKRAAQLVNKTNQFNLTTRRYTEAQLRSLVTMPGCWARVFDLSDRFGAHGLVGLLMCRESGADSWEIDTWLMSCRVLGRQLERLMLDCAVAAARERGVSRLVGVYRPTPRNALVADLFETLGFARAGAGDGEYRHELDLSNVRRPYSTLIEVAPSEKAPAGITAAADA